MLFKYTTFLLILNVLKLVCSSNNSVAVLILARGGSKGVRLKNLQKVGNISLLAQSIQTSRIAGFDDVTVSTDHFLIALEALRSGAKIFQRSKVTASDVAPSIWGAQEFLQHRLDVKVLVLLQATSPFLKADSLRLGLRKLFGKPSTFDCVFSVYRSFKLRWKFSNGKLLPLNFNIKSRPRRQDWSGDLLEAGAFYISKAQLVKNGYFQNDKYVFMNLIRTMDGISYIIKVKQQSKLGLLLFTSERKRKK